jgi:hypothetical protein
LSQFGLDWLPLLSSKQPQVALYHVHGLSLILLARKVFQHRAEMPLGRVDCADLILVGHALER